MWLHYMSMSIFISQKPRCQNYKIDIIQLCSTLRTCHIVCSLSEAVLSLADLVRSLLLIAVRTRLVSVRLHYIWRIVQKVQPTAVA